MSPAAAFSALMPPGRPRVAGGAMRARLLARISDPLRDLHGCCGCAEMLNITRAKLIANTHQRMLRAGAELLFTNTAGAAPQLLDRFRMHDEAFAVSYLGAEIASGVARREGRGGSRPLVVGDVRMPRHLPVLGFITRDEVEAAVRSMVSAQVAGGVDAVCLQTAHRPEHLLAAFAGARAGMTEAGRRVPVLLSIRHDPFGPRVDGDRETQNLVSAAVLGHAVGAAALSIEIPETAGAAVDRLVVLAGAVDAALLLAPGESEPIVHRCMADPIIGGRLIFVGAEEPGQAWRLSRFMPARPKPSETLYSSSNDNASESVGRSIKEVRR